MRPSEVAYLKVEVAHKVVCEVEAGHLEEQFVLVDGVWMVCESEHEAAFALGSERRLLYRIAVVEHLGATVPHALHVEPAAVEPPSGLHAVDYHACQFADAALGILLYYLLHIGHAAVGIAAVELGHASDEEELVAVGTQREAFFRHSAAAFHLAVAPGAERFVGGSVERVLYVFAKLGVLDEVRVAEQSRPLAVGVGRLQLLQVAFGLAGSVHALIEQVEVVQHLVHLLV